MHSMGLIRHGVSEDKQKRFGSQLPTIKRINAAVASKSDYAKCLALEGDLTSDVHAGWSTPNQEWAMDFIVDGLGQRADGAHPQRGRRLHARLPGAGGGHVTP